MWSWKLGDVKIYKERFEWSGRWEGHEWMGVRGASQLEKGYSCSLELYDLMANDVIGLTW